jgi:hypothetical protein
VACLVVVLEIGIVVHQERSDRRLPELYAHCGAGSHCGSYDAGRCLQKPFQVRPEFGRISCVVEPVCDRTENLWPQERVQSVPGSGELVDHLRCSRQTHAQLGAHPQRIDR